MLLRRNEDKDPELDAEAREEDNISSCAFTSGGTLKSIRELEWIQSLGHGAGRRQERKGNMCKDVR